VGPFFRHNTPACLPRRFVIIDLSPVTDIDSSAMHFLGEGTLLLI